MQSPANTNILVLYNLEQESAYVRHLVSKMPWYQDHGYALENIKLPAGVSGSSSTSEIDEALRGEYSDEKYRAHAQLLKKQWKSVEGAFLKLKSNSAIRVHDHYGVVLTRYGMGGSYDLETNQVIIRIGTKQEASLLGVVVHEIVHMTMQHLIDQYCISHWRKERLVDLMVERYFPGLNKMQRTREDVSLVDSAFEEFFPNIEAMTKSIGNC